MLLRRNFQQQTSSVPSSCSSKRHLLLFASSILLSCAQRQASSSSSATSASSSTTTANNPLSTLKFKINQESALNSFALTQARSDRLIKLLESCSSKEALSQTLTREKLRELYAAERPHLPNGEATIYPVLELGQEKELPQIRKAAIAVCKKLILGKKLPDAVAPAAFSVLCADAQWINFVNEETSKPKTEDQQQQEDLNTKGTSTATSTTNPRETPRALFNQSFRHLLTSFVISSLNVDSDRMCVPRVSQSLAALLCLLEQIELLFPASMWDDVPKSKEEAAERRNYLETHTEFYIRSRVEIACENCLKGLWSDDIEKLLTTTTAKDERKRSLTVTSQTNEVAPLPVNSHLFFYVFGQLWDRSVYRLAENNFKYGTMRTLQKFTEVMLPGRVHVTFTMWADRLIRELALKTSLQSKRDLLERLENGNKKILNNSNKVVNNDSSSSSGNNENNNNNDSSPAVNRQTEFQIEKTQREIALLEKEIESSLFLSDEVFEDTTTVNTLSLAIAMSKKSSLVMTKSLPLLSFSYATKQIVQTPGTATSSKEKSASSRSEVGDLLLSSEDDTSTQHVVNKSTETKTTSSDETKNLEASASSSTGNGSSGSVEDEHQNALLATNGLRQKQLQLPKQFAPGWGILVRNTLMRQLKDSFSFDDNKNEAADGTEEKKEVLDVDGEDDDANTTTAHNSVMEKLVSIIQPIIDATSRLETQATMTATETAIKDAVVQLYRKHPAVHIKAAQLDKETNIEMRKSLLIQKLQKNIDNDDASSDNNNNNTNNSTVNNFTTKPLFATRAEHLLTEHARETLMNRISKCQSLRTYSKLMNELPLMKSEGPLIQAVKNASEAIAKTLRNNNVRASSNDELLTNDSSQETVFMHLTTWLRCVEFETRYSTWRDRNAMEEILHQPLLGGNSGSGGGEIAATTTTPNTNDSSSPSLSSSSSLLDVSDDFMCRPQAPPKAHNPERPHSFTFLRAARSVALLNPDYLVGQEVDDNSNNNSNPSTASTSSSLMKKEERARVWLRLAAFGLVEYTSCEVPDPECFLMKETEKQQRKGNATGTASIINHTVPSQNDMIVEAAAAPCLQLMSEMSKHKKLTVKSEMLKEAKIAVLGRMLKKCAKLKMPKFVSGEEAVEDFYRNNVLLSTTTKAATSESSSSESSSTTAAEHDDNNIDIRKVIQDLLLSEESSSISAPSTGSPKVSRRRILDSHYEVAVNSFIPEFHQNSKVLIDGIGAPSSSMWRLLANAVSMITVAPEENMVKVFVDDFKLFNNEQEVFDSLVNTICCCLAQISLADSRAPKEHQLSRILLYVAAMSRSNEQLANTFAKSEAFKKMYPRALKSCVRYRPSPHHHHHHVPIGRPQLDSDGNDINAAAGEKAGLEFQLRALISLASASPLVISETLTSTQKREIVDPFRDSISRGTFPPSSWKSGDVATVFIAVCSIPELLAFATNQFFDRIAQRLDEFRLSELRTMKLVLKSSSAAMSGLTAGLVEGINQRLPASECGDDGETDSDKANHNNNNNNNKKTSFSLSSQLNLPKHASDAAKIQLIRKLSNLNNGSENTTSVDEKTELSASDLLQCLQASDKQGPGLILRTTVRSRIMKDLRSRKENEFPQFAASMIPSVNDGQSINNTSKKNDSIHQEMFLNVRNQTLIELARTMSTSFFGDTELWQEWNSWIEEWMQKKSPSDNTGRDDVYFLSRTDRLALKAVQYVAGVEVS